MSETIIVALIGAGVGTLVACAFQLINRILDYKNEERIRKRDEKKSYEEKKEEVYIAAIERLQQVRHGFDVTQEDLSFNKKLADEIQERELAFAPLAAKLRLYASDEIFFEYYRLMSYARYAFAPRNGPRLLENSKEAFSQQVLILSRRMQADLGIRDYNEGNTEIKCPECETHHDAFEKCPKCGMSYTEYMRRMQMSALYQINNVEDLSPYSKNEYDCYCLLKFTGEYKHQKEFIEGKLFFNTADYFMMCDEKGRGDSSEGTAWEINPNKDGFKAANLSMLKGRTLIEIIDYSGKPEDYQPGSIFSYSPAENRCRKILSLYTLYVDSKNDCIQDIPEKMYEEFGGFGILITDAVEFYKRLEAGIRNLKTAKRAQLGYVEYYSDDHPGLVEFTPFLKKKEYSYQNEFRATFIDDTRNPIVVDVGDLSDIAKPIFKDDIAKIFMKDGKLNYPKYIITNEG